MTAAALSLRLEPMSEEQCRQYVAVKLDADARDRAVAEGCSLDLAREAVNRQTALLLPQAFRTPGHYFWNVVEEGAVVGGVWFQDYVVAGPGCCGGSDAPDTSAHDGSLWGIDILPAHRRRGLGGAVMGMIEAEARRLGCRVLRLHVFPQNEAAVALYRKAGLAPTNVFMAKPLA